MNNASSKLVARSSGGKMSPDPRLTEVSGCVSGSDVPSINFLQLEDSDSDATPEDDGYELLNATELDNYDICDDDPLQRSNVDLNQSSSSSVTQWVTMNGVEGKEDEGQDERPSASEVKRNSCQLTPDETEVIKSVMKEIKLPESAIPSWASVIPEEKWKSMLDSKTKGKSSPDSSDD